MLSKSRWLLLLPKSRGPVRRSTLPIHHASEGAAPRSPSMVMRSADEVRRHSIHVPPARSASARPRSAGNGLHGRRRCKMHQVSRKPHLNLIQSITCEAMGRRPGSSASSPAVDLCGKGAMTLTEWGRRTCTFPTLDSGRCPGVEECGIDPVFGDFDQGMSTWLKSLLSHESYSETPYTSSKINGGMGD
uniref:Uncharacterized protein n=1 Tax=Arundo donax TaxID=35708 RepID=A0A0A9ELL1_ARUDO